MPADECAFREDSVALCSQLRTISIEHRIAEVVGSIPDERLQKSILHSSTVSDSVTSNISRSSIPSRSSTSSPELASYFRREPAANRENECDGAERPDRVRRGCRRTYPRTANRRAWPE
nr:type II toxin-antitoxin system PemK/MazF family toxin [Natronobacterium gregoryi]